MRQPINNNLTTEARSHSGAIALSMTRRASVPLCLRGSFFSSN